MSYRSSESEARVQQLREILTDYLLRAGCPRWPGTDGQTVQDVLHIFAQAASAGLVPNPQRIAVEHPELAQEVRAFFGAPEDSSSGKRD